MKDGRVKRVSRHRRTARLSLPTLLISVASIAIYAVVDQGFRIKCMQGERKGYGL